MLMNLDLCNFGRMDRQMTWNFTSFSTVISGQWADDNERLCAMEPRLRLGRFCLAGLEPGTDSSVGLPFTHELSGLLGFGRENHIYITEEIQYLSMVEETNQVMLSIQD